MIEWIKSSSGRVSLSVVIVVCAFLAGYLKGHQTTAPVAPIINQQTHDKKSEQANIKTVIEIKKPDGTLITKTQNVEKSTKEKSENAVKEDKTPLQRRYSLGIEYLPSLTQPPSAKDVEITAGSRLGTSPVWLKGGYDIKHNQFKIGIEYTW